MNNEQELISRVRAGDKEAFTELYRLYSERLYVNLIRLVKSPDLAEEMVQDIFMKVWERRESFEIHASFRSYLLRAGENRVVDFYRKVRRDRKLYAYIRNIASEQYTYVEEQLLRRENNEILQRAIAHLSPQRKQVFEYCKIQGKSYQEVSAMLNISPSTINDHIVKATRTIREFLHSHQELTLTVALFSFLR